MTVYLVSIRYEGVLGICTTEEKAKAMVAKYKSDHSYIFDDFDIEPFTLNAAPKY